MSAEATLFAGTVDLIVGRKVESGREDFTAWWPTGHQGVGTSIDLAYTTSAMRTLDRLLASAARKSEHRFEQT